MANKEKVFADGLIYKEPRENAPAFVKGSLSIKVADFVAFLQANETNSGWINIDIKESQGGKLYCELNTYMPQKPNIEPKEEVPTIEYPQDDEIDLSNVPF
jgi:hypothetical protein